ncbi:MAG TPA: NADH-quinone oxidoreductase subunit M [Thermoanaerobaculia bacterium]|nr:NADH-quinone oxidoreductase subunit M [Thermoanaerobaculia bacterium]
MDNLLSTILWLPLVGAVILVAVPRGRDEVFKTGGLLVSLATFLVSLVMLGRFREGEAGFQLVETRPWIPSWGINYSLGVDGISLWLVLLTTLLTPVVLLASRTSITKYVKEYVIAMLVLELGMIGTFLALDLLVFYIFFELMLLPMYLIIGVWGGANRVYAAIKFFLFTIAGSLLMLLAIIYLVFLQYQETGIPSFAISDLYAISIPFNVQAMLFFAFALAFAIKVPLFPLHTWLPDAHVEAPTGGSIILAGVLLKIGTYGFIRFVLPFFPEATARYAPWLATLAVIGIIYGALVAWVQADLKKLVAYSSVSHLGFCVLGIFALDQAAMEGSILQMINHGLSTGALFLLVGVIYERRHTRLMEDFGGLAKSMPLFATIFVIATLSSAGLPGLNGFVGEFLILAGSFRWSPLFATIAATGVILAALYLLLMLQKVLFGPITREENRTVRDMRWHELVAVLPLVILMFWIGFFPGTFLRKMTPSVQQLLTSVQAGRSAPGTHLVDGIDPHARRVAHLEPDRLRDAPTKAETGGGTR